MSDYLNENHKNYEYNDAVNVLVAYCKNCGTDTGIATRITQKEAFKEFDYNCQCGYKGNCESAIIKEQNKEVWQSKMYTY